MFYEKVMACAEYAKLLKSDILVVHGDEFPYDKMLYTTAAALEYNVRFFHDLVDYAAKNGMRVAFENTFQEPTMPEKPHFSSAVEDLCALVDHFGTETVGICWDTGHARVAVWREGKRSTPRRGRARDLHALYEDFIQNGGISAGAFVLKRG